MKPRIVVVGSANSDLVIRVPQLPRPGETVIGGHFEIVAGGKGANQAVAAARAGAHVTLIANIGRDAFGDARLEGLRREGIDTRFVVRSRTAPSGVALIVVGARGENLIAVAGGSNDELQPWHLDVPRAAIRAARCVVVQLEIPSPTVRRLMRWARYYSVPVLLNPAPAGLVAADIVRRATFLTPNESELAALSGSPVRRKREVEAAARRLRALGVEHVIATCGARGVCWCGPNGLRWFPARRVKPVDTVGAGDCFSGVLAAAIAEGASVEAAIRFAVAAAAISVTRPGAQSSMPTRREIERLT